MTKENFDIAKFVDDCGCFDLQFRKDIRHKRTGSPTYYRWKIQFVAVCPKEKYDLLKKIGKELKCGKLSLSGNQARYSVQKIEDICSCIIPYLKKNQPQGKKKNHFNLWQKAAQIIQNNKGKNLANWKRNDFLQLLEIQKISAKHKEKPKQAKWLKSAEEMAKILK